MIQGRKERKDNENCKINFHLGILELIYIKEEHMFLNLLRKPFKLLMHAGDVYLKRGLKERNYLFIVDV